MLSKDPSPARSRITSQRATHRVAPVCTYRLQLRPNIDLSELVDTLDYLSELGVSHVYFAPYFKSSRGSSHGYDIVDFNAVEDALGDDGHAALCNEIHARGLGHIVDMVPNHMGVESPENRWWWDVLRQGARSPFASYFDVDWDLDAEHKIVLPILSDHYAESLRSSAFRLEWSADRELTLVVGRHVLPINAAGITLLAGRDLAEVATQRELLDQVVRLQHYRLTYWRSGSGALNYRRFLDISGLAAVRVEDPEVFDAVHARLVQWVEQGLVDGVRIDHPDGLADPAAYFERLRGALPGAWIVGEKVLERGRSLPESWPIDGTTGYEFLNLASGLFVDPSAGGALTETYARFVGTVSENLPEFAQIVRDCKRLVLRDLLVGELARTTEVALRLAIALGVDTSRQRVLEAVEELVVCLSIGRTYISPGVAPTRDELLALDGAVAAARRARPKLSTEFSLIYGTLTRVPSDSSSSSLAEELVRRFQQLSGAAMAKGAEDTAFYQYGRLYCVNELGADPGTLGSSVDDFHRMCGLFQREMPQTLLTTSTHDTKRSEDVRLRIALLSQLHHEWSEAVFAWSELISRETAESIDRETEYLVFQTLVGAWPITEERLLPYVRKAVREAKRHTSWVEPDFEYEERVDAFVRHALRQPELRHSVEAFVAKLLPAAETHSIALSLLKLTAPGIPDIYQGTELWDDSLADPDNRRPVDFPKRRELLRSLDRLSPEALREHRDEGLSKLWAIRQALRVRRALPNCFGSKGSYERLPSFGRHADRVVSFMRGGRVAVVVPRLVHGISDWSGTKIALPPGRFHNFLTLESVEGTSNCAELFERFPAALLVRSEATK